MRHIRLTALLLALLLSLSLALPAFADVLWEPDNRFYQDHYGDCEYHNRGYTTNSPKGYVDIRSAPDGVVTAQAENGQRVNVYFTYQDWGYISNTGMEGWALLSELSLIYDYRSFEAEHGDEILGVDKSVTAPLFDAYMETGKTVLVFWPYPNAERMSYYETGAPALELLEALKEYGVLTYTDEEGHLWGFCSYLYGRRNFWILLDDPSAGDGYPADPEDPEGEVGERIVSVRETPKAVITPTQKPPLPPAATLLTAGLVAAAVLLSGGALWLFYGKKRRSRPAL